MRTILFAVTAACGVGMFGTPGPAVAQVEFYQEGNRLYQEGDFEGALASYLRLVEAGFESIESHGTKRETTAAYLWVGIENFIGLVEG